MIDVFLIKERESWLFTLMLLNWNVDVVAKNKKFIKINNKRTKHFFILVWINQKIFIFINPFNLLLYMDVAFIHLFICVVSSEIINQIFTKLYIDFIFYDQIFKKSGLTWRDTIEGRSIYRPNVHVEFKLTDRFC